MTARRRDAPRAPHDPAVVRRAHSWRRWLLEGELTRAELLNFRAWLLQAQENRAAYRYIESIDGEFSAQQAVLHIDRANDLYAPRRGAPRRSPWRWLLLFFLLLLLTAAVGLIATDQGLRTLPQRLFADHAAGLGERARVELPDGTVIQLGSRTAFNLSPASGRYDLDLIEGEIYIAQPQGSSRIEISSDAGGASAQGAHFGYRDVRGHAVVSVVEGQVVALLGDGASDARGLEAGEEVTLDGRVLGATRPLKAEDTLAWRRRMLADSAWTLESLVAELRRYHAGVILIVDPGIAERTVVFPRRQTTSDPASVLRQTARRLDVGYSEILGERILLLGEFSFGN